MENVWVLASVWGRLGADRDTRCYVANAQTE